VKMAPKVQHLLRGRMARGKPGGFNAPLRAELRALLAVARAARQLEIVASDWANGGAALDPDIAITECRRALARLEKVSAP